MRLQTLFLFMSLMVLYSCAWNKPALEHEASILPDRAASVGFFSRLHRSIRDTERATYGFIYGVRDGVDSFIYDAQKDYYEDYQK